METKKIEDLYWEHSQHETKIPNRCSECWAEEYERISCEEDVWKTNKFAKEWKEKNDAKKKELNKLEELRIQTSEDKLRAEAEDAERSDYEKHENEQDEE